MTQSSSQGGESERSARLEAELAETHERLREFDHRIKNDLQLIASILMLQQRKAPPGPERDVARGALERVNCVLAVHRRLSPAHELTQMNVAPLVREIAEEALGAARREDVTLDLELAPLTVPSRQAAPLALITGELVRNALRHAYPGRGGRILVRLSRQGADVELLVADEGVGRGHAAHGFGATLINLLAQQLRGEVEWSDARPGVRALLRFPEAS